MEEEKNQDDPKMKPSYEFDSVIKNTSEHSLEDLVEEQAWFNKNEKISEVIINIGKGPGILDLKAQYNKPCLLPIVVSKLFEHEYSQIQLTFFTLQEEKIVPLVSKGLASFSSNHITLKFLKVKGEKGFKPQEFKDLLVDIVRNGLGELKKRVTLKFWIVYFICWRLVNRLKEGFQTQKKLTNVLRSVLEIF